MSERVLVRVPASTANLGPGFDTLGMALNMYTWIEMSLAEETRVTLYGKQLEGIPADASNLIYQVAQQVFDEAGENHPHLEIKVRSDIPLTRGLGSSASAIVGGMAAANALIGNKLSQDAMFQLATKLEDHPDNVGASLFGGIVAAHWDGVRAEYIRIEPHDRLEVLVIIPDFHLSTEKARNVLPQQIPMRDAVHNIACASLLVAALATGNLDMIRHAMRDALHQPYRAKLVPGMDRILAEATNHGALGVALSGAGPTLLALADSNSAEKARLETFLLDVLKREDVPADTLWLHPEREGVRILTPDGEHSTLFDNKRVEGELYR